MSEDILFEKDGAVAFLTLNRPTKYNVISYDMWDKLVEILWSLEFESDIKCLVIRAAGDNFCAGTDIGDLGTTVEWSPGQRAAFAAQRMELTNRVFTAIERIPQIVLCSVRGLAAGGGFGMAVCGDMVIASDTAKFKVATLALGSVPDVGVPMQLVRNMSVKKAMQYCILEEFLPATEALDFGLLNWLVPDAELEAETLKIAKRIAEAPQPGAALAKAAVLNTWTRSLGDHLKQEAEDVAKCVIHPGYVDRIDAFFARQQAKKAAKSS